MSDTGLVQIIEAALMAAGEPLPVQRLAQLFDELERPSNEDIRTALAEVAERCEGHGFELVEVASGWRFQVRQNLATWVARLWQERPQRYSRALLETLSLIAYRQPITRGEIEEIRGVAVSSNIVKTLQERDWIRVVGHRDVPGRPAMYATTKQFLDYFNLKSLEDLPPLAEIKELDNLSGNLLLEEVVAAGAGDDESPDDADMASALAAQALDTDDDALVDNTDEAPQDAAQEAALEDDSVHAMEQDEDIGDAAQQADAPPVTQSNGESAERALDGAGEEDQERQ